MFSIRCGIALLAMVGVGCAEQPTPSRSAPAAFGALAAAGAHSGAREVKLRTKDGWSLVGDLYAPEGASKGALVLLHQRGGQASDWTSLSQALQQAGFTVLAIDQRGAGRSTEGPGPTGNDAPWPTGGDIEAALDLLKGRGAFGLIGASYGANNALIYAAAHPHQVRGVALLSPGANYNGLDALSAARRYPGSVAIYHDSDDSIAGGGPQQILHLLPGRDHRLRLEKGSDHGTALLNEETISDIVRYFQRILK